MLRNTNTEKWKDAWFTGLSPSDKLVFIFLTENCDMAGFYELNLELIVKLTGIQMNDLVKSLKVLQRSFVPNKRDLRPRKIWLKKYLLHQNCLPLNSSNQEHMKIKFMLESSLDDFNNDSSILAIINSAVKQDKKSNSKIDKKKFVVPEWDEFRDYYISIYNNEQSARRLFDHYISVGWKVGAKKMVDWKASIRKNIPNHQNNNGSNYNNQKNSEQQTRTSHLKKASESFLNDTSLDD